MEDWGLGWRLFRLCEGVGRMVCVNLFIRLPNANTTVRMPNTSTDTNIGFASLTHHNTTPRRRLMQTKHTYTHKNTQEHTRTHKNAPEHTRTHPNTPEHTRTHTNNTHKTHTKHTKHTQNTQTQTRTLQPGGGVDLLVGLGWLRFG